MDGPTRSLDVITSGWSGEQKLILRVVKSGQQPWLLGAHLP
jgi:hypothetical protein